MAGKAQKAIHIKWVRSGIGFPYRQKDAVRSLGLRRLNQVVERPDTPQIRGLVSTVPHLVEIVASEPKPAWTSVPEYTLYLPEAGAVKPVRAKKKKPAEEVAERHAPAEASKADAARLGEKAGAKRAKEALARAKPERARKPAKAVAEKGKAAKAVEGKKGKAAAKETKPAKKGKK